MTATETGVDSQVPAAMIAPGLTPAQRLRAILGGSSGNLVEWYDWFVYSVFAVYFSAHFFPGDDDLAGLLKTMAVFAVGFFARPLGAWLMGLYADRAGRKTALTAAVTLMCGGSLIIAVLPGYETIGIAAPILLVFARILQGLSVGGEYGASATYLSEMAGKRRRGFWSSFQFVTMVMGQLIALGVLSFMQLTMDRADIEAWGWRIPFFIGAALAVVVFWLRSGIHESPGFENARAAGGARGKTMLLFVKHPKQTLMVMGLTAGGSLAYYVYTSYMQKFLINTTGFSKETASQVMVAALFCFMLMQPLFGWISDKVGRKPLLLFAYGGGMLATWPLLSAIAGATNAFAAFGLIMIALTFQSGYSSISGLFKAEMFPAHIRALGVALPYALANSIFGGSAEAVALSFKADGVESNFYIYVTAILLVGFITVILLPDTKKTSLIEED